MSHVELLRENVELFNQLLKDAKADLAERMPDANPLTVRDTNGRYVLLDAMRDLVRAQTVLVEVEQLLR